MTVQKVANWSSAPLFNYVVAEWYCAGLCDLEVAVSTPAVAAVYQRQLSVPSLRVG